MCSRGSRWCCRFGIRWVRWLEGMGDGGGVRGYVFEGSGDIQG
jgi:hypothetical protein